MEDWLQLNSAIEVLPFLAVVGSVFAIIRAIIFQRRSEMAFRELNKKVDKTSDRLDEAVKQYDNRVEEFLQFQGLRGYLRQALELYGKAERRVISVARVWLVSKELEDILKVMINKPLLKVDLCGPATLDEMFPHLLWRLHLVYVASKADPSRFRFWASRKDLPVRFSVSDDTVLIAGAPSSRIPEETFGWQQVGDKDAADFYADTFTNWLARGPSPLRAEEVLISELKEEFNAKIRVGTVVDALVTMVFQKKYEPHPHKKAWGDKVQAVRFEQMLREWLASLGERYPQLVEVDSNYITFR